MCLMVKTGDTPKLTTKQMAFVCAYLQCFNATKAAKQAGYSVGSARQIGSDNMTKAYIRAEIHRRLDTEGITPSRIKVALSEIAFSESEETQHRLSGLDKLTKISGMYVDKVEHSGRIDSLITQENYGDMDDDRKARLLRTAGLADVPGGDDGANTGAVDSGGV